MNSLENLGKEREIVVNAKDTNYKFFMKDGRLFVSSLYSDKKYEVWNVINVMYKLAIKAPVIEVEIKGLNFLIIDPKIRIQV